MGKGVLTSLEGFSISIEVNHPSSKAELHTWFDKLAVCLMNHLALQVGKNSYRIVECEVYYNNGTSHGDPFVHGAINRKKNHPQETCGHLYWNDAGGIDLTFGKQGIFGGILIRSMRKLDVNNDSLYFNGPWSITSEIISGLGNILGGTGTIQLVDAKSGFFDTRIKSSTRVNLKPTEKFPEEVLRNSAVEFRSKPYRYVAETSNSANRFLEKTTVQNSNSIQ